MREAAKRRWSDPVYRAKLLDAAATRKAACDQMSDWDKANQRRRSMQRNAERVSKRTKA
jgi:hypothetical protein